MLEEKEKFDEKLKFSGDKACQGEELIKTPTKKPKKQELTSKQIAKALQKVFIVGV